MHAENFDGPAVNKGDTADTEGKKALPEGENTAHMEGVAGSVPPEGISDDAGAEGNLDDVVDRRKYPRSEFTYPVEFRLFSQNSEHASFKGYLKDISVSGACLQFEDRYGRFDSKEMNNAKIKISFSIPDGDKTSIFALIRWVGKSVPRNFLIMIGIEFQDIEPWQLGIVEKLITMRNKDHNMMWNLWEQYESRR
ncbi:MAG: PilZ domain-containing protein [Nitrospiraceae bacterium]|nr:MAG: PilZ domain-containing protein [Nitrospiraceae bacterium]